MKLIYFTILFILNLCLLLCLKIDNYIIKTQTLINYLKKEISDEVLNDNLESKNIALLLNKHLIRNNINFCKNFFFNCNIS